MKKKFDMKKKLYITILLWAIYAVFLIFFSSTSLTITNFLVHLLLLFVVLFIYRNDLENYKNEFDKNKKSNILKVLFYMAIIWGVYILSNTFVNILVKNFGFNSSNGALMQLFKNAPYGTMFVCFTSIVFYPIVEELVFRKSLRDVISNPILFVIISSLVNWYFQVTIINPSVNELIIALPTLLYSVVAAIIMVKKDNILYTIYPRMIYNIIICGIQLIALL